MDFERRIAGLQEQLAAGGLATAAYGPSADFQYLTGLAMGWRAGPEPQGPNALVLVAPHVPPVLLLDQAAAECAPETWIENVRVLGEGEAIGPAVRVVLADLVAKGTRVAAAGRIGAAAAAALREAAGEDLEDAAGLLDDLRRIKDPEEVEWLRRVARLTDEVYAAVIPFLREGVTQGDVEAEIQLQGKRLGAEAVSFPPAAVFTKSGTAPAAEPFVYPRDKGLVPGTSIAFDFGFVREGYCSDSGRSVYFGPAPDHIRDAYAALQQSVVDVVATMRDGGPRMCDLFPAVERSLDAAGFGQYLRARLPGGVLGHNIGIDVHEDPWARPESDQPLRANMVMALEPKLWHSGEYYLRVEDMVLVGEDGAEFLTRFDRTVFQL